MAPTGSLTAGTHDFGLSHEPATSHWSRHRPTVAKVGFRAGQPMNRAVLIGLGR
jgi:hypothetical protein